MLGLGCSHVRVPEVTAGFNVVNTSHSTNLPWPAHRPVTLAFSSRLVATTVAVCAFLKQLACAGCQVCSWQQEEHRYLPTNAGSLRQEQTELYDSKDLLKSRAQPSNVFWPSRIPYDKPSHPLFLLFLQLLFGRWKS